MSATADLTEPRVLAHTKQALFGADSEDSYVVADTQFAKDRWVKGATIGGDVKNTLSPFNHVRVGSGYPDLVGARSTDSVGEYVLNTESTVGETALIAVEAKGYTGASAGVDLETGVAQAHDRLSGANAAYLSAPSESIGTSVRGMARELNVGVLGVSPDGSVTVYEKPRPVGVQRTTSTNAIRFQATAQGVANQYFGLNHPKNYLGYVIAVYSSARTEEAVKEYVVGAVPDARKGAEFLGLIDTTGGSEDLTSLGKEVVRFAVSKHGDVETALEKFADWKRSRKRFTEVAPQWGLVARRVVFEYPATELIVEELQRLHDRGITEPSLKEFVLSLYDSHPSFAVELFVSNKEEKRERVFLDDDTLDAEALEDGSMYQPSTTFQLKAMMYHTGILTDTGAEPSNIDPTEDIWKLLESV
jgi:hypothetical protein